MTRTLLAFPADSLFQEHSHQYKHTKTGLNVSTEVHQDVVEITENNEKAASSDAALFAMLEANLTDKFSTGLSMVTAHLLAPSFPTLFSIPNMFINAYKNVLATAMATGYTYPQAEKVKYLEGIEIFDRTLADNPLNDIPSVSTGGINSAMAERNSLSGSDAPNVDSEMVVDSLIKARVDAALATLLPRAEIPQGNLSLDTDDVALVRALVRKILRQLFAEGRTPSFDDFANAIKKFVGQTTYLGSNPTPIADIVLHMGKLLIMGEDLSTARDECHRNTFKNRVFKLDEEIARVKAELAGLETQTPLLHDQAAKLRTQGLERLERIKDLQKAHLVEVSEYSSIQIQLSDCEQGLHNIESLAATRAMILAELETARGKMLSLTDSAASKHALLDRVYHSHMKRVREAFTDFDL